jgi:uncharacterized protein YgiM (DUF1202 family)
MEAEEKQLWQFIDYDRGKDLMIESDEITSEQLYQIFKSKQ